MFVSIVPPAGFKEDKRDRALDCIELHLNLTFINVILAQAPS